MRLIGMIIGMGVLAMLFQTAIHGVANLMNGLAFWHQSHRHGLGAGSAPWDRDMDSSNISFEETERS